MNLGSEVSKFSIEFLSTVSSFHSGLKESDLKLERDLQRLKIAK